MSRISVLGFTTLPSSSPRGDATNNTRWAILVEPEQKEKKHGSVFHHDSSKSAEPTVLDVHGGELRRYSTASEASSLHGDKDHDDLPVVKILVATPSTSSGITARVESVLRRMPTSSKGVGMVSSGDWLQAALTVLQCDGLIRRFDVDQFYAFAAETMRKQLPEEAHSGGQEVLEVDYLAKVQQNDRVKAMFGLAPPVPAPAAKKKSAFSHGFWISRPRFAMKPARKVRSWERQDDPYGGLM